MRGHLGQVPRARQAELDRVRTEGELREAELKATEQRKRRKVQLAFFGAVALLVFTAGAFAWWQDRQTTIRRVEAENRDADERQRLARNAAAVESLLAQCEDALRAVNDAPESFGTRRINTRNACVRVGRMQDLPYQHARDT
jgi:hypothetical protein